MRLVEQHIIKQKHALWETCDKLCSLSKNLYNASLYDKRQYYFQTKKYKSFNTQRPEFVKVNNVDYRALPAKVAGEVLQQTDRDFRSFFNLLKKKNDRQYDKPIQLPKYKAKNGRNIVVFPKDTISKQIIDLQNGLFELTLCKRDLNIRIKSKQENVDNVRIVPKLNYYVIEVVYTVDDVAEKVFDGNYAGVDLGVNNVVSLVSNSFSPLLYGSFVKSINQFYNKELARLKSELPKGVKTSKRIKALHNKRNFKLNTEFHRISRDIVNHLVSHGVTKLVIGYNKEWKQDINIGRRNNQNFVMIPFMRLVGQLVYKCKKVGISVVLTEESYTSKCSFLDREIVGKKDVYYGKRVKRGLFRSLDGKVLNADVNGAFNIVRKVVPDTIVYSKGIEGFAVNPLRVKSIK